MKKALIYISIILGVLLFGFFSLVLVMMLAPGTEIFGVKYVSAVVGKYEKTINQTITGKDIYINTGKVPVTVHFGDKSPLGVEFVQHYQGFTKVSNYPSVTLTNKDGKEYNPNTDSAIYINVTEYKKFVWARDNIKYYLNINLPSEYASTNSIYINSSSSSVSLEGGNQTLSSFSFSSSSGLSIKNKLTVTNNFTVNCKRYIELGDNVTIAGNFVATAVNENVKVTNPVGGNVTFTSGSGDLYFNTCNNLTVKTGSGSIKKPTSNQISGNLNVSTNGGNVEIGTVCGSANKIVSRAGFIKIDKCLGLLEIETNRSTVTLGELANAKITTTTGDITIAKTTGDLNATASASGEIICGAVGGNAVINTKIGDVTFTGAITGNLDVTTNSGNVKMVSCKNLKFTSESGSLKPNATKIDVGGDLNVVKSSREIIIDRVSGNAKVNSKTGSVTIDTIAGSLEFASDSASLNVKHTKQVVKAESSYSHITIGSAEDGVNIKTSGNVRVGELGSVGAAIINSGNGTITLKNTTAKVDIISNGQIDYTNDSSTDIRINRTTNIRGDDVLAGRGSVTARNLKGSVRVYSAGDVNLTFNGDVNLVRVNTDSTSKKVVLNLKDVAYNAITYWLNSDKGSDCKVFAGSNQLGETKSTIKNPDGLNQNEYKIVVLTTYATIGLNLADVG